jgi:hypothetical protein
MRTALAAFAMAVLLLSCDSNSRLKVTIDPSAPGDKMCSLAHKEVTAGHGVVPVVSVVQGEATLRITDSTGRTVYENPWGAGEPNNGPSLPAESTVDLSPGHYTAICETDQRSVRRPFTAAD